MSEPDVVLMEFRASSQANSPRQAMGARPGALKVGASVIRKIVLLSALSIGVLCSTVALPRSYTVEDSVALRTLAGAASLANREMNWTSGSDVAPSVSPDGKSVVLVVSHGDLAADNNVFEVIRFNAADIQHLLSQKHPTQARLPKYSVLFTVLSPRSGPAIENLRWMEADSSQLSFVASPGHGAMEQQVFTFDMRSNRKLQVTHHAGRIRDYGFSPDGRRLVFSADSNPDWSRRYSDGYVVTGGVTLRDLMTSDPSRMPELKYFVLDVPTGRERAIDLDPTFLSSQSPISVDPSGRFALLRVTFPRIPRHWTEYAAVQAMYPRTWMQGSWPGVLWGSADTALEGHEKAHTDVGQLTEDDVFGGRLGRLERYVVLDLNVGTSRPLIDSPIPIDSQKIRWSSDGSVLSLSSAYLPLGGTGGVERQLRAKQAVPVQVRISDGTVTEASGDSQRPWSESTEHHAVRFELQAGANQVYELAAMSRTGKPVRIMNLNPQLAEIAFGPLQSLSWTDAWGRKWQSLVQLPLGYEQGHRYPLVIETNASTGFELPSPTHAPGQLLSSKGIVVLRVACQPGGEVSAAARALEKKDELGGRVVCMQGGIEELARRGVIDEKRVGIVGFSFTGNHAMHAVTFYPKTFRTAVIVDAAQSTLWNYVLSYGMPRAGMMEWDSVDPVVDDIPSFIGAQLFGTGVNAWLKRSPTFNVDKIQAPILFEYHGTDWPPGAWDVFAILKRAGRPVEMIHYPTGEHELDLPRQRLSSQTRILDWMVFWLNGAIDGDANKKDQFERWLQFKAQVGTEASGNDGS